MHIHCLGLNHRTASLHQRERLAYTDPQVRSALARLGHDTDLADIQEMVILSTCNRVEIYAVASRPSFDTLEAFLAGTHDLPLEAISPYLYRLADQQAVKHLLRVAAGLDSLVPGEPQILGQVIHALEMARQEDAAGPLLSRLFQTAIHAGKRVRSETRIGHNPASIPSLAAGLIERSLPSLKQAQVVVMGAGEMAELAVEALRKRGAERILVVNRTLQRARQLAQRWQAEALALEHLEQALIKADILIASTAAPHTLIHPSMLARVMQTRPQRPLVAMDIAVPRNIDPEVKHIPGVHVYDMDSLHHLLEQNLGQRLQEVPAAEAILAQEEAAFMQYLSSQEMLAVIADLHQQAEAIRQAELEKTLRRLPELSQAERQRIDALTRALVKKLLDGPTTRLRAAAGTAAAPYYVAATRALFDRGEPATPAPQPLHESRKT